jgi:Ca2+-transporting ATPase
MAHTNDNTQGNKENSSWYQQSVASVIEALETNEHDGVAADSIPTRQDQYGTNTMPENQATGFFGRLFKQFANPLVLILLVAGLVTLAVGHFIDSAVIFVALAVNVIIGVIQEGRASKAFAALSESQGTQATVIRDGKKQVIPAEDVVVGDLVVLTSGMSVPADIRIVREQNLKINEAALTGEWMAVAKDQKAIDTEKSVPDRNNMAWKGTLVSSGSGRGVVTAVGENTEVGKIAQELATGTDTETPIQKHMQQLAKFVAVVSVLAVVVIFVLGLLRGQPLIEMLVYSIAIAVSVVPEGLPAAVTVVLALGMKKILDRGGLVRNLQAAETLGSTTTILTDKTGTLTEAKMKLDELITADDQGKASQHEADNLSDQKQHLLAAAVANTEAFIEQGGEEDRVHGEPIEKALVMYGQKAGIEKGRLDDTREDFIAFSSENRYSLSLRAVDNGSEVRNEFTVSGAPEVLLGMADKVRTESGTEKLTESRRAELLKTVEKRSASGKRVIAVGFKPTDKKDIPREKEGVPANEAVSGLVFAGIISFVDPVREDVAESIQQAKGAGVNVVMITGDNAQTASFIAQEAGVASEGVEPITGPELEDMSDEEIIKVIRKRNVFARVLPKQKLRIAKLLQERNEVVAMTGDGVNDAPALRTADIGVSVGSGTEVAKEASDLVLLDDSFSIIVAAIEEGRRIIDNLKKIIAHLLSTSFGGLFLIGGALVVGLAVPITTPQILWVNIVEGGLLTFVFAAEPPAPDVMERDPSSVRTQNLISTPMKWLVAASGSITGIAAFIIYVFLSGQAIALETVRTMMFVILTIDALFFVAALKNFYKPVFKIDFSNNSFLFLSIFLSLIALFGAVFIPPLRNLLGLTTLSGQQWLFLAGVGVFDLIVVEIAKYLLFQRSGR